MMKDFISKISTLTVQKLSFVENFSLKEIMMSSNLFLLLN